MTRLDEQVYHFFLQRRRRKYAVAETVRGCGVVSVGNLSTGGTGKTPTVQFLAWGLQRRGARVAVVARGYGGSLSGRGAIVSNGKTILLDAEQAGDEPLLHARSLPDVVVIIGRDRVAAVKRAVSEFGCNVVLLDDAFQYWSLARDFNLVLLDARRPFGNGHLLPRGRLREPESALSRASAVLLTRADAATEEELENTRSLVAQQTSAPIYTASHQVVALRDEATSQQKELAILSAQKVATLSALADNVGFQQSLRGLKADVVATCARRDHHAWRAEEVRKFSRQAQECGATAVVTTAKDAVKLRASWFEPLPLWSLLIELRLLGGEDLLWRDVEAAVGSYLDAGEEPQNDD
jgi:tetraacyldisaccharide 4'-kinase